MLKLLPMIDDNDREFSKEWLKAIYSLKKSIDLWAMANLQDLWEGKFQASYMQFLLSIKPTGSTNKELAKENGISKQAMSKLLLRLEELEVLEFSPNPTDRRYVRIKLSAKGEDIIQETISRFTILISSYQNEMGLAKRRKNEETLALVKYFIKKFS